MCHKQTATHKESDYLTLQKSNIRFTFSTISNEQMITLFSNSSNTGPVHDGIPMFVFKENAEVHSLVLTHIWNMSLSESIFPPNLSIASVSCLYKAVGLTNYGVYRHMAILPSFSKVLGKKS